MAAIMPVMNAPQGRSRSVSVGSAFGGGGSGSPSGSSLLSSLLSSLAALPSRCMISPAGGSSRPASLTQLEPLALTDVDDGDGLTAGEATVHGAAGGECPTGSVRLGRAYLEGGGGLYSCCNCRVHLAAQDDLVSKCFQGRGGRAFLVERCVNVRVGPSEERLLMTGLHAVADISCLCCDTLLGWKYEEAFESSQKYKEGKFILEKAKVVFDRDPDSHSIQQGSRLWPGQDTYGAKQGYRRGPCSVAVGDFHVFSYGDHEVTA